MAKQCLKITVSGNVHGVSYRAYVKEQAEKLKIEGTAQNLESGEVIILVCSDSEVLDDFIDVLYDGPKEASVANVVAEPLGVPKDFRGVFRVIG